MNSEQELRTRLNDSRAMAASLDINENRVLLKFGDLGQIKAVVLAVKGNEISIVSPGDLANAWREEDADKRGGKAPLASDEPIVAFFDGENLYAGEGGPLIELPESFAVAGGEGNQSGEFVSFPAGQTLLAHFDGDKLTAGEGGPEIALPNEFFDAAREAITAEIAANGATTAEDGSGAGSGSANENGAGGPAPANDGGAKPEWVDFERHKVDDIKALAKAEGVELAAEDNTKREIAAKINAKRGAVDPSTAK